jgi:TM2 domain-containing membrane protein YozV
LSLKFFLSTLFIVTMLCSAKQALASQNAILLTDYTQIVFDENELAKDQLNLPTEKKIKLITLLQKATVENKKVTAAILTLTLGMLGVHRIYLGTAPYIPAVYLFTFGGGFFILPIIDLVMILSTNDISKFENNKRLLMWAGE